MLTKLSSLCHAGRELQELGVTGREESELLTQADVDFRRPRDTAPVRRPSVVQFKDLEEAASAAPWEAQPAPKPQRFQARLISLMHI